MKTNIKNHKDDNMAKAKPGFSSAVKLAILLLLVICTAQLGRAQDNVIHVDSGSTVHVAVGTYSVTSGTTAWNAVQASGADAVLIADGPLTVNTTGTQNHGVYAAASGSVFLNQGFAITVNGTLAYGASANNGYISLTGVSIMGSIQVNEVAGRGLSAETNGVIDFSSGTVATSGANSSTIHSESGGVINVRNASLSSSGTGNTTAVSINAGGTATLLNTSVMTNGLQGLGLAANGAAALISGSGVTLTTSGSAARGIMSQVGGMVDLVDSSISTQGEDAFAVYAYAGGTVALRDSAVTTTATTGTAGYGLLANLQDSVITATNVQVTTSGTDAYGVNATQSGRIEYTGGTVSTSGYAAYGLYALLSSTINAQNVRVNTTGGNATGVDAANSLINLTSGTVTTSGLAARGMLANDTNGIIKAQDVLVSTSGGAADGVFAFNGGQINLTSGTVTTSGAASRGVRSGIANSSVNAQDVLVNTSGGAAEGLYAYSSGLIHYTGGTVTTSGNLAHGLYATTSGIINTQNTVASTTGTAAHGVYTDAGGEVNFTGGSVSTSGAGANGVYSNGGTSVVKDAVVSVNGPNAAALRTGSGGMITFDGGQLSTVMTPEQNTWGALADSSGGKIQFQGTASTGSTALWVQNGGTMAFSGSSSAKGSRAVADGLLDISTLNSGTLNVGSLEGANSGVVQLGANTLVVGGNVTPADLASTTYNGAINGAGGLIKQGSGILSFAGTGNKTYTGDTRVDAGTLAALNADALAAGSKHLVNGGATLQLNGFNQTVAGLANNGTVDLAGNSNQVGTVLTVNGDLSGSGAIRLNTDVATHLADTVMVNGAANGAQQSIRVNNQNDANVTGREQPLLLVHTEASDGNNAFGNGTVGLGMYAYTIENGVNAGVAGGSSNDYYLTLQTTTQPDNGGIDSGVTQPELGPGGYGVLDMAVAAQSLWFNDTLLKRMGELRLGGAHDWDVWVRSYGKQWNMSSKVAGNAFTQYIYGIDIGADKAWQIDRRNTLYTGVFGGYGRVDQDYRSYAGDASVDGYEFGVYATWVHETGWYADLVGKGQYYDNSFDISDDYGETTRGGYNNWAGGASLELGRQFKFKDGWYAEPQVQASYGHFTGANYRTGGDNRFPVQVKDSDVLQFRFGSLFGRTIPLGGASVLQPYLKVFGQEQISNGGEVLASDGKWRPNLDGASALIGGGLNWQLDDRNQINLDYEAQFGSKYDMPWGVNFSFRHRF